MSKADSTIIVGSLNDQELKNAIDSIVTHVEKKTNEMAGKFDDTVANMEARFKKLSNLKVDIGGATNQTKAIKDGTQAIKEQASTYDQLAQSMRAAAAHAQKRFEVSDIQNYRMQLHSLDAEIKKTERVSLEKAISQYKELGDKIEYAKHRIAELTGIMPKLRTSEQKNDAAAEIERLTLQIRILKGEMAKIDPLSGNAARLQTLRNEYDQVLRKIRQMGEALGGVEQKQKQATQSAQQYTDAIKKQADAIRKSAEWQERGTALVSTKAGQDYVVYAKSKISLEQQLLNIEQDVNNVLAARSREEQKEANEKRANIANATRQLEVERKVTEEVSKRKKYTAPDFNSSFDKIFSKALGGSGIAVKWDEETSSIKTMTNALNQYRKVYENLSAVERNSPFGKQLVTNMQVLERSVKQVKDNLSRLPKVAIDSLPTRTLDEMAFKMRQLATYRGGLNVETQKKEIADVNKAYNDLKKRMDEVMQKNKYMINSNNALARSWNYMKNRLAFYFTVGASTQFIRNLIQVRSEYEMNERALGILINSAERGSQIFNELSQMALVSPYTLIELSAAAKQLTAYDVAAKDVVDTTRRLADMASAVGIPIERLTYALGQIKAYGYLNSRDNRMFANAGIPLVKQLADHYTELEGKLVSTADVYDRIKKKAVGYNDVMQVIYKMTDEGGKFFDFQAKMADTLKVRLANLTLAWNNMLNDIGKSQQGVLTTAIDALKSLFLHWKQFDEAINSVAKIAGLVIGLRTLSFMVNRLSIALGASVEKMAVAEIAGKRFGNVLKTLGGSFAALAKSPVLWVTLAATVIGELTSAIFGANKAQQEFNKSVRDGAKDNYDNIEKFINQYSDLRDSLYKTEERKGKKVTVTQDIDKDEAAKAWEVIREEIELTSIASNEYIGRLLQINNISERVRQGFTALENIKTVSAALKDIGDDAIKVGKDVSIFFGAITLNEGLVSSLKSYQKELNKVTKEWGSLGAAAANGSVDAQKDLRELDSKLFDFRNNINATTRSILQFVELKGWSGDVNKINEAFSQITNKIAIDNQLSPQEAFTLQMQIEEARAKAARQALETRIADERAALKIRNDEQIAQNLKMHLEELKNFEHFNGESRVYWSDFTKWMKEQHLSEMTAMFRGMDAEQIKTLDFQKGKYFNWVNALVKKYAEEHHLAYSDVFKTLKSYITSANQWSIFIPLTISTEDSKSLFETLSEADTAADAAWKKIQRLKKRRDELAAKGGFLAKDKQDREDYIASLDEIAKAQKDYNDAIAKGGHSQKEDADAKRESAKNARQSAKEQRQAESELQRALKDELSLIDKVRNDYKTLTKEGYDSKRALSESVSGFDETVASINKTFAKFGLTPLDLAKYAGVANPREVMNMLQEQLDKLVKTSLAKPSEIKDLQVKLKDLKIESITFDQKTITESLNNELSKLKDEYELTVELDANPELGDMFEDILGIDRNTLPSSFGEAFDRANAIAKDKLKQLKVDTKGFDLMSTIIKPDKNNMWEGLDYKSQPVQDILKWQDTFRDMFKKNIADTEKMLDDYVKKYGDYSDKVAEIEADRLEKIKRLNEAYYNEEMRKRPDYARKLTAIEQGALREKGQAKFDEFKNTRLYIAMFENLEYASTSTLQTIREKLAELRNEMGSLSPEQLKQIMQEYEKIDTELTKRNPFKSLVKNAKDYAKAIGKDGREAQKDFVTAQRKYDWQLKIVAAMKQELEQSKRQAPWNAETIADLAKQLGIEEEKLAKLKEELDLAEGVNNKYDLMRKVFGEQAAAIGMTLQMVAANIQSLSELRDNLHDIFGVELGAELDAVIDDLNQVGEGINKVVSSANGGDAVGVVTGVVKTFTGIGDAIASIFGDGAARTKKINKEIDKSRESVWRLNLAYKDLERAIDKSLGSAETAARRAAIANKEAELAEIERQLVLEKQKRKKDRDSDAIKEYQEKAQDLRNEIEDLGNDLITNLLGSDVKSAAEDFVDTWVDAWKAGETTLDAISNKMDEMIFNLIKKAAASKLVATLLQPLYDTVDAYTQETSAGGVDLTREEIKALATLSGELGVKINEALGAFYGDLETLGAVSRTMESSGELSALQQGIQGITETTAGALEAYMNGVSQQVYLHSDLLTQIRDIMLGYNVDVQTASLGQILMQLQASYQAQMAIQNILTNTLNPAGSGFKVELIS